VEIRLLIADDHDLFLDGIVSLLKPEKYLTIETAGDGYEVLEKLKSKQYDVCLLDIGMPKLDGIATVKILREAKSTIKIIILSTYNDKEIVSEMMMAGINGYLLKNCTRQELIAAINKVYDGGNYFSDEVQSTIVNQFTTYLTNGKNKRDVVLTNREVEIVQLLAQEYTNDKIAELLNISYRTVETHRKNIMQKTDSHNLAGLLKFAYEHNLVG
jgi:DNA-binding NarL/FixJ family response regulator